MIVINLLKIKNYHIQLKIAKDMISISGENWFIEINSWHGISYTFKWDEYPPVTFLKWRK